MAGKVKAVPDGYHTVTPYLRIRGAAEAIEFYRRALGAWRQFAWQCPMVAWGTPSSRSATP